MSRGNMREELQDPRISKYKGWGEGRRGSPGGPLPLTRADQGRKGRVPGWRSPAQIVFGLIQFTTGGLCLCKVGWILDYTTQQPCKYLGKLLSEAQSLSMKGR